MRVGVSKQKCNTKIKCSQCQIREPPFPLSPSRARGTDSEVSGRTRRYSEDAAPLIYRSNEERLILSFETWLDETWTVNNIRFGALKKNFYRTNRSRKICPGDRRLQKEAKIPGETKPFREDVPLRKGKEAVFSRIGEKIGEARPSRNA